MANLLSHVYFEITSYCNEHCSYCYNEESLKKHDAISLELFMSVIDEIKEKGLNEIAISGGEPFLHPDICTLIEYASKKGISLKFNTNFTVYDEKLYNVISQNPVYIQVTLDGASPEMHDYTRGKGTFSKIDANLNRLMACGFNNHPILVRMNLHKKNYAYIEDVVKYAKAYTDTVSLNLLRFVGAASNFKDAIEYDDKETIQKIKKLSVDLSKKYAINVYFIDDKESLSCPYYYKDGGVGCGLRIAANGDVYPCPYFVDKIFSIGNLKDGTLTQIINSNKMENFITLLSLRKNYIPECVECAYKGACKTGCPAEAYYMTGNIFGSCSKCDRNKEMLNNTFSKILKQDKYKLSKQ